MFGKMLTIFTQTDHSIPVLVGCTFQSPGDAVSFAARAIDIALLVGVISGEPGYWFHFDPFKKASTARRTSSETDRPVFFDRRFIASICLSVR